MNEKTQKQQGKKKISKISRQIDDEKKKTRTNPAISGMREIASIQIL